MNFLFNTLFPGVVSGSIFKGYRIKHYVFILYFVVCYTCTELFCSRFTSDILNYS